MLDPPPGRGVLKDLEDGLAAAPVEMQLLHDGAGMHVEVLAHPVAVVGAVRPERVHVLAAEHVDEELVRLVQVRNSETDVIKPRQAG